MAFRTFLSSLGINAPEVDTRPGRTVVRPGEELGFTVVVRGGGAAVEVDRLLVELVLRTEASENSDTSWANPDTALSVVIDPFELAAGEERVFERTLTVPWTLPLTHARGTALKGARSALRTTLEIDNAVDRGDFDEIQVHGLPVQDAFFAAFEKLGFRFHEAEGKKGYARQQKTRTGGFRQELEFWFPASYRYTAGGQLEVGLVPTGPDEVEALIGSLDPVFFTAKEMTVEKWAEWLDATCRPRWAN
ncbi:sporulation protein [Streptomyces sp. NPDC000594]|uniref:sporulation protein n=1 Tax=Streptomyces sp. NPDC000594 TaxID=3154261 RepID=UPI0033215E8C